MTQFIAGALWAFFAGSVTAALVAAVVGTFIRLKRPAAATRCTLWLLVLTTCVLAPAAILGAMSLPHVRSSTHANGVRSSHASSVRSERHGSHRPGANALVPRRLLERPTLTGKIANAIAALWFGGALAGCVGLLRSISRVHALKRRSSPLDGSLADDLPWLTQRRGREIYLRLSYEIETPIAIGFRRPVVLIPTEMATVGGLVAIEPLVMHEYAHLARYDDWTNLWQRVIERLVWCNPLVWYAGRRLALEREVAADDAVVQRTHDATHYASTLWRLAREMRMPEHVVVAPGAMLTRKQLSIRIERLLEDSAEPQPYVGAGLAVAAFAACTVAVVAAAAPRFDFTRSAAHLVNAQLFLPRAPRAATHVARATSTPARARAATSSPISEFSRRAGEHGAAVRAGRVATPAPMLIARTVPSTPPIPAIAPTLRGVSAEAQGPYRHGCTGCDLQNADLRGQNFVGAHFEGTNMQNADLRGAKLGGAVLVGVNLENANLDGADLRGAQLNGTNLNGASMRRTLTTGMSLTGTSLP